MQLLITHDRCPVCSRAAIPPSNSLSLCTEHDVIQYGISFWLVWVSSPSYVPFQLLVYLIGRAQEAEKSLTAQQQLKTSVYDQHSSNSKPKCSTIPITRKKIYHIPAETRIISNYYKSTELHSLNTKIW